MSVLDLELALRPVLGVDLVLKAHLKWVVGLVAVTDSAAVVTRAVVLHPDSRLLQHRHRHHNEDPSIKFACISLPCRLSRDGSEQCCN